LPEICDFLSKGYAKIGQTGADNFILAKWKGQKHKITTCGRDRTQDNKKVYYTMYQLLRQIVSIDITQKTLGIFSVQKWEEIQEAMNR